MTESVKSRAKPFQLATVDAVMRSFNRKRRLRRFLVADEVGLGKTIVAQEVIRRMMSKSQKPLTVFYMCSNLAIAKQNRDNLLKLLPPGEREDAQCQIDRLSMLAVYPLPTHRKLHLYSLTPHTSIPIRKKQRRDGRQEERALVHALVEKTCPGLFKEFGKNVFQRQAGRHWRNHVKSQKEVAGSSTLRASFVESVRKEFGVEPYKQLLPVLEKYRDDPLALIAHMRNALAAGAIENVQPDLVIFDEFQKFRDLLSPDLSDAERRVIGRLRGDEASNPLALLLLSATPYRLFSRRWEDESGSSHRSEFFELIEFLFGGDKQAKENRKACEQGFQDLESELRKGEAKSSIAVEARRRIEDLLRPIIARTERASHDIGWAVPETKLLKADLNSKDIEIYCHFSDSLHANHKSAAVPYWTSIPMPMQTMGNHYVVWQNAKSEKPRGVSQLNKTMRNRFSKPTEWPHPRLRKLTKELNPKALATPWIPPTAPWWQLKGAWANKETTPSKLLIFSRFWAVPQSVASMISFNMEASLIGRENLPYAEVTKRRSLSASDKRHAILGLFHPSPTLVLGTDPLAEPASSLSEVKQSMRKQVKVLLQGLGIKVRSKAPHIPVWKLLGQLDYQSGYWDRVREAWRKVKNENSTATDNSSGLSRLLKDWNREAKKTIGEINNKALNSLVEYSLGSPGVVVGRSLLRHWSDAVSEKGYYYTLKASWNGLRNYLDQRWFFSSLSRRKEKFPNAIRRAVIEGNLESVLDEHLWISSKTGDLSEAELANELARGFDIKMGQFNMHPIQGDTEKTFSMRCHVALPFTQQNATSVDGSQDKRVRPDDIRRAFNTPFWPYVLATTSVGQEGLDFHTWCDSLLHWDLCKNPADLEQREGRIQRFGGLSIRRAIQENVKLNKSESMDTEISPWERIANAADEQLSDNSGLVPWWVCEGGGVNRYVFHVPTSEQNHWLHWMQEQRLLYRLALGQPNQEDLVEVLRSKGTTDPNEIREAVINLSPWFAEQRDG